MKLKIIMALQVFIVVVLFSGGTVDAVGITSPVTSAAAAPGTMILIGTGLVWMAAYGRKKFRK